MSDRTNHSDSSVELLVADLADEFRRRQAHGEWPDPAELAARHPAHADLIRDVLSAMQLAPPPARRADLAPGGLGHGVLGDYRIVRAVGQGGMGVVYEAEQLSLGRRVALKVLPFAALADPRLLQRFRNEARAAAALDHPHVVKVHAVGEDRGVHYIAMQFVDGRPLSELIRTAHMPGVPSPTAPTVSLLAAPRHPPELQPTAPGGKQPTLPNAPTADFFRRVAELGAQAAEALEHAHALGVVHRDVKPGNLLLDAKGDLWVSDFGLAKVAAADAGVTRTGDVFGTLRYMSPEQALAKHDLVDHRTDVYALGATLYELACGRPAVDGSDRAEILRRVTESDPVPLRRINRAVPADLEKVINKCLRKEPNDRYASARELADDLRRFVNGQPVVARPIGALPRTARWVRRNPRAAIAGAVLAALVAALAVSSVLLWQQRERAEQAHAAEVLERQRAQDAFSEEKRHRARARNAVDTMYTDVAEKLLVGEPEMSGPRKEFLLKALAFYEEEIAEQPDDHEAEFRLAWACKRAARIYWAAEEHEKALPLYNRAVAMIDRLAADDPHQIDRRTAQAIFYFERSWVHHALGRLSEAMADRRRSLDVFATLARDYPNERAFRVQTGGCTGYIGMLETDPADAERDYRDGIALLEPLARQFPSDVSISLELAHVNHRLGRHLAKQPGRESEAENVLTQAVATWRGYFDGPNFNPEILYLLGAGLVDIGQVQTHSARSAAKAAQSFAEAEPVFRRLESYHPGHNFDGYQYLGQALIKTGRWDKAIEWYREAVHVRPKDPELQYQLAVALERKGLAADAETAYREAIRQRANWAEPHCQLGGVLVRLGRAAEAVPLYSNAFTLDPKLLAALNSYRYEAARAAALAASGNGHGTKSIPEDDRARFRQLAYRWLTAELAAWKAVSAWPFIGAAQSSAMDHWRHDPDLVSVRDPAALTEIPETERSDWRSLWAEVDRLATNPCSDPRAMGSASRIVPSR